MVKNFLRVSRKMLCLAMLWSFVIHCANAEEQTFQVHGQQLICRHIYLIDARMSGPDYNFFDGWSDDDYKEALRLIRSCPMPELPGSANYLSSELAKKKQSMRIGEARDRQAKADADERKRAEDERRKREEDYRLASIKADEAKRDLQNKIDQCHETPKYKYYWAADAVVNDIEGIKELQDGLADQRKISSISGVRDLAAERQLGEGIYETRQGLTSHFEYYRQQGGKAKSPAAVKRVPDPCDGIGRN